MGDIYSTLSPDVARAATAGAPQSHAPAPGFFDTIGLSFKQAGAAPDWGLNQSRWEGDAVDELETSLAAKGVHVEQPRPLPVVGVLVADRRRYIEQLLGAADRLRSADPKFLPDYAGVNDSAALAALVHKRRAERATALGVELQDAGTVPWLVGALGHGLTDPTSYVPVGGGPVTGSIARQIIGLGLKEGAANAVIAIAQEPLVRADSAALGFERTFGDTLLDIGVQAATGFVIGGAGKGAGIGGNAVLDRVSPNRHADAFGKAMDQTIRAATWDGSQDGRFVTDLLSPDGWNAVRAKDAGTSDQRAAVAAFEKAVPAGQRTADEQAAVNVVTREADVKEASPFHATPEGDDAQADLLGSTLDALAKGQPVQDRPAPVPAPKRVAGAVGLPSDIVAGLKARGVPDHIAKGVAAGIVAESRGNHRIVNPDSGASFLGQWLGSRKQELMRRYGPSPTREQQLDFIVWELNGGDHGGPKVMAAADEVGALNSYIRDFMRPAAGRETTGDLERGMAALGRGEEALPADMLADGPGEAPAAPDLSGSEAAFASVRSDALDGGSLAGMIVGGQPVPLAFARFTPDQVEVDAGLMQFKHGGDAMGVTDSYARVDRWNPALADPIIVWESNSGRTVLADGHQRHGIARRSMDRYPDHPVEMDAYVMREADGFSAQDARLFAAFKNVAQGHGGPLDFAKLLSETGGVLPVGIDTAKAALRDARGIVKLDGEARAMAFAEQVPASFAGIIGNLMPFDEPRQVALMRLLQEAQPANMTQATSIIRDGIEAGFAEGEQFDLFGGSAQAISKLKTRARILDDALTELRKRKLVLATTAKEADMIERAGSSIDRGAAQKEADANAQALEIVARLASVHGPVKQALDAATDAVTVGAKRAAAARQFADAVAGIDLDAIARADPDAGGAGDGLGAGRYAADAVAGDAGAPARNGNDAVGEAVAQADAEAAPHANLFDDPVGPAAIEQAALIRHDVEMTEAPPVDDDLLAELAAVDAEKKEAAALRACLTAKGDA